GDKASMEIPSPVAGKVTAIEVKVGDKVKTGSPMLNVEVEGSTPKAAPAATTTTSAPASTAASTTAGNKPATASADKGGFVENEAYVHASPLIRRLAREFGVNLANVKGSGRKNRILREDVQAYVKEAVQGYERGTAAGGAGMPGLLPWPKVDFSKFGE